MITVQLRDVHIDGAHGIYAGEEGVGNPYVVDLDVSYEENGSDLSQLGNTVNYVSLFGIVNEQMSQPEGLLEKLCEKIIRQIHEQYPFVREITLSIHKLQAPVRSLHGRVGVTMNKKFYE